MAERVEVRLNRLDIRNLTVRFASRRVETVLKEIEALSKLESRGPYSTGRTAASIHRVMWVQGSTVRGEVRAGSPHAKWAEEGVRPHPIHPIAPDGTMVFYWRKVGRVVHFKRPHIRMHPGYAGKHFLSGPARTVGRRHRFIVITYD
jgi:hypothetical protein